MTDTEGLAAKDGTRGGPEFRTMIKSLLLILFLSVTSISTIVPRAAQAQSYSFSSIQIEGTQRIEAATIYSYLGITRGEAVSAGELNAGYQRLVASGLFESVEITPSGSTLIVKVVEFPTISRVSIEGNKRLKDDILLPLLVTKPRYVYSPAKAEQDAATIIEAYQSQGRLAVEVTPKIIRRSNNRVDVVFEVVEAKNVEIERLSFVGNRAYSDKRLRAVLSTKQAGLLRVFVKSDTFSADRIEFDKQVLTDFYRSHGYVDFQVLAVSSEVTEGRDGYFVTFQIQEGQSFDIGEVTTVSEIAEADAEDFQAVAKLKSGSTYSPTAIENTIARMERLALSKGIDFARVTPRITRNDRDLTLDIEFVIERGERIVVERIDIEGNATTLDRVIRNQFNLVEGDPFNPREIRNAAERIRALGYFADAEVTTREGTADDRVIVDVNVEEQPTGTFSIGATYSLEYGVGGALQFSERNFLGRGQYLSFSLTAGVDDQNYSLTFAEPNFLDRDLTLGITASYVTSSQSNEYYDTESITLRPYLEFPVNEYARMGVRVFAEGTEMSNVSPDSSVILQNEADRGFEVGAGVGVTYTFDNMRTGLNPDAGIRFRFETDFGGLGADSEYIRSVAKLNARTTIMDGAVELRGALEGGAVYALSGEGTRAVDRFYMGSSVMRGFSANGLGPRDLEADNEDALGGNYYAAARLEAEFPIGLPEEYGVTGGLFLDAGSVWGLDQTLGTNGVTVDDSAYLRSVVGASIFWVTPIGPLRFNYSWALAKESYDVENQFEFTLSTQF